jgi:8-oxo-dGTP diphosphatase
MTQEHNASPGIIKAASACVWRGDTLLLVQRAAPHGRGLWAFPGGKLEPGESLLQAAQRELLEETGVVAALAHHVGDFDVTLPQRRFRISCFTGHWQAGEAVAASDAAAVRWVTRAEMATLPLAPHIETAAGLAFKLASV